MFDWWNTRKSKIYTAAGHTQSSWNTYIIPLFFFFAQSIVFTFETNVVLKQKEKKEWMKKRQVHNNNEHSAKWERDVLVAGCLVSVSDAWRFGSWPNSCLSSSGGAASERTRERVRFVDPRCRETRLRYTRIAECVSMFSRSFLPNAQSAMERVAGEGAEARRVVLPE